MTTNAIQQATAKAPSDRKQQTTLKQYVDSMKSEIQRALPSVMTPERFTRITLSALSGNPQLQQSTPQSFLAAMMTAAQLGMEPNTPLGQAYLIPYRNHGVMETQFQLGYKGLIDLAYRSGEISVIQAHTVYARDDFDYEFGLEPKLTHRPYMGADKGDPVAFYGMFKTKDGGFGFEVMSVDDVRAHARRYSKAYDSETSPWRTSFEEMAKKTVLKRVLKYAPLKSDFARQLAADGTIRRDIAPDMTEVPSDPAVYTDAEIVDHESGEVIRTEAEVKPAER